VVAAHDDRGHAGAVVPLPPTLVLIPFGADIAIEPAALISDLRRADRVRLCAFVPQAGISRGYVRNAIPRAGFPLQRRMFV
jgi:hypothetical protein